MKKLFLLLFVGFVHCFPPKERNRLNSRSNSIGHTGKHYIVEGKSFDTLIIRGGHSVKARAIVFLCLRTPCNVRDTFYLYGQ